MAILQLIMHCLLHVTRHWSCCFFNACNGTDMFVATVQVLESCMKMMVTSISGQSTMQQPLLTKQEKLLMKPLPMELAGKCYPKAYMLL